MQKKKITNVQMYFTLFLRNTGIVISKYQNRCDNSDI